MGLFAARWILPIDRPVIHRGWIEVQDHRIVRVSDGTPPRGTVDLGSVALLPGLVNAHTHLEGSWLEGIVGPAESFADWVRAIIATRSNTAVGPDDRRAAMRRAAWRMRQTGTVAIGDISNTLTSLPAMREAGLSGRVFHELIGFDVPDASRLVQDAWARVDAVLQEEADAEADPDGPILSACVVAHAPYSVSPELFSEIARRHRGGPLSVHLAESAPEIELLRRGTGPMRQLLEELGVWRPSWVAPGCEPVEYLSRLGYLMPGLLAAHGTHLVSAAMERLRDTGATIVTCPRSNVWVGGGLPPLARYYASGVAVAIGTDSLASSPSLNLFDELAECRRVAPEVTAASLLESATLVGARSLGLEADFGTLTAGKRADLVSVDVPPTVSDVEEYLVGGVSPGAIRAFAP